jgi:uncharacterized protein (DUF934 family)
MRVIKDEVILEDNWRLIADDEYLPEAGDIIVSYARWQHERELLTSRSGKLGICINGDVKPSALVADLPYFALIALEFPKFVDGRCFSHARLLRERYHFAGELRAIGDVWRDQLFYMRRCGIDSFAVREDKDMQDALKAFSEYTVTYQPAADGAPPIYHLR